MDEYENNEELENSENNEDMDNSEEGGEPSPQSGEDSAPSGEEDSSITKEEIIDALKELIEENADSEDDIEGTNLLLNEDSEKSDLEAPAPVDYTEILNDIKAELLIQGEAIEEIRAQNDYTIFDKPLNEFTVSESILALLGLAVIVCAVSALIKHYTPKIWH